MKRLLLTIFSVVLLFVHLDVQAQAKKTKVKDDKVKIKDGDKKVKMEGDETKTKDGNTKIKTDGDESKTKDGDKKVKKDGDETKTKDGNTKIKTDGDESKTKDGNTKIKTDGDETKTKDGNTKIKTEADEMKIKSDTAKLKVEGVTPTATTTMPTSNNTMSTMPYRADYSSQFVMGNPMHATRILELWKDYDDNTFQRHVDYYADTASFMTSDGMLFKGRDSSLAMVSRYRSGLTNVKSTVDAWLPIRSTDRNEDWVAIWGTETNTDSQGKTTTSAIHELWKFNKDGKVASMRQYAAQQPK